MVKSSPLQEAMKRVWITETQQRKAEAFDEIARILAQERKKPGPKGGRQEVRIRRLLIKALHDGGKKDRSLCEELQIHKLKLPSKTLRADFGDYAWIQWFNKYPRAVKRQIDADLRRCPKH